MLGQRIFPLLALLALTGCQTAADHAREVQSEPDGSNAKLTVGKVQREIRVGMPAAEVAKALGSPNIVSKSDTGEVWIYDKISTDTVYSRSEGGVAALILGGGPVGGGIAGGGIGPSYSQGSGATSTSQRTLTVIVELENARVKNFNYHASRF